MKKLSITRRLIVSIVITQLVLTAAVILLATYLMRWQLRNAFESALHGRAMSIAALVRFSEDEHPRLMFDSTLLPPPIDRGQHDLFEIVSSDGRVIGKSSNWNDQVASSPPSQERSSWNAHIGPTEYRVLRLKDIPVLDSEGPQVTQSAKITVFYAASTEEIREHMWQVAILTCVGSLVLLGIATTTAVWAVRKGLLPLNALATSAGKVTPQDWQLHAPEYARGTVELAPLTAAMDRMLLTLQQAFTSQREFVTNAAHELKTPIAVLKSTLQLALQRPRTQEEYRTELQHALDDVARLETLSHSLLRLARAEQLQDGRYRQNLPLVDVAASVEQSVERWRSMGEAKSVAIKTNTAAGSELHGDADDLELIWSNLLDNAIRFSAGGSEVNVSVSTDNGSVRVEVNDAGPGIDEEKLSHIFDRFHRGDPSRSRETGGYGLGLAIAKAMVEAYGGSIQVESRLGNGTKFSVQIPVRS